MAHKICGDSTDGSVHLVACIFICSRSVVAHISRNGARIQEEDERHSPVGIRSSR